MGADNDRDPSFVAVRAVNEWTTWLPGDGSSYRVHVTSIVAGPDHADRLLLVNIGRRTWAFQWSAADYRHRESGRWTAAKARGQGIPAWVWDACLPLLDVLGATRDLDKPVKRKKAAPAESTVEAAGGVL